MEIEFKDDTGRLSGRKVYLLLRSGDSFLNSREHDSAEVFKVWNEGNQFYWMEQVVPVILVVRKSSGQVSWMEIGDWLKRASKNGLTSFSEILFEGKRFDVMSVHGWRDLTPSLFP
jgi:hypothetical protein